jgi:acyl carrier protein phosphodiesterase
MNFLAHAYLSFQHPQILVGNMISDFVKGAAKNNYPNDIRQGIMLHREIDSFTDTHAATKKAKEVFRPHYRLYSGPIMDVIYDHFLANDKTLFPGEELRPFVQSVYTVLEENTALLPGRFVQMLFYMRLEDWLYHYKYERGIEKSLAGLIRRAAYVSESRTAFALFLEHYAVLQQCYDDFFPDVKQFAKQRFHELLAG